MRRTAAYLPVERLPGVVSRSMTMTRAPVYDREKAPAAPAIPLPTMITGSSSLIFKPHRIRACHGRASFKRLNLYGMASAEMPP